MKALEPQTVTLHPVATPDFGLPAEPPSLPDHLFGTRLAAVRQAMHAHKLDFLAVYADREHYANFRYLVGFEPRFEEGVLIVSADDPSFLMLGNECFPMHAVAKIPVKPILCQALSLPNQPLDFFSSMQDLFEQAGIKKGMRVGLAGWKLFTPRHGRDWQAMFCVPAFIAQSLIAIAGAEAVTNATGLFIDPETGLRIVNEPEQAAVFAYGAAIAGQSVCNVWENAAVGKSELEVAGNFIQQGMQLSCHPIVSAGPNIARGLVSPTGYRLREGDPFCVSFGLEGGLTCRGGYLVEQESALPAGKKPISAISPCRIMPLWQAGTKTSASAPQAGRYSTWRNRSFPKTFWLGSEPWPFDRQ